MTQALVQLGKIIFEIDSQYEVASICTITVAVQSLDGLLQEHPKKVAEQIDKFISILELTVKDQVNYYLLDKAHILDFIVSVIEKYPKLAKNKKGRASKLFKLAMDIVCSMSSQTSEQWLNPHDGFQTEDELDVDSQTITQIMSTVDTLALAITFQHAVKNFLPLFLEYIQNTIDWRISFAALVVASQIAVEGATVEALDLIVQHAIAMVEHFHPKVRYAALQLIGQFSSDLETQFQQTYYNTLVPVSIKLLQDPVPRVVAHTFSCLSNFFQKCKLLWKLQTILGDYLNPIFHYIKTGSTWVKQQAIATLSTLGQTEGVFGPNLPTIFEYGSEIVSGCIGKPEYKQVLNLAMQLISILLSHQKKQLVEPYLPQFINLLLSHKNQITPKYFLKCWTRLSVTFQEFCDISQIYPSIFQTVKQMLIEIESQEDCAEGLSCLTNILKSNKSKAAPFKTETAQFAKNAFINNQVGKIRQEAVLLLVATITSTKPVQPQAMVLWWNEATQEYKFLLDTIQNILDNESYSAIELPYLFDPIEGLVISFNGCLTGADIITMSQKLINLVLKIDLVYNQYNCGQYGQQNEDEQIDSGQQQAFQLKITNDAIQQGLQKIGDTLEQLLKQIVEPTTKQTVYKLYQNEIKRYLQKYHNKNHITIHFALVLAVQILTQFSYTQIKADYPFFIHILCQFIQNPIPRIRNVVAFGFKIIFMKISANELGTQEVSSFLQYLSKGFMTDFPPNPRDNDHAFYIKHCKDNVISALGILLKNHAAFHPTLLNDLVYKFWLTNLPLNADKKEGNQQQEILIEILNTNPGLIIKQASDLLCLLQIYAKFLMKRGDQKYNQIKAKTKQSLFIMKEWSLFQQSSDHLWNSLSDNHKKTLLSLMSS